METRLGDSAGSRKACQLLAVVLFFCAPLQAAALPLDPSYGAGVELGNFGIHLYTGQTSAAGSVTSGIAGAALAEGAADFGAIPSVHVNLVSAPGGGMFARAYLFDTLTFHVASGGSAVVPVRIAGTWTAKGSGAAVSFFLGLGSHNYTGHGYATGYFDGQPESAGFTYSGDYITGVIGSYLFDVPFSVADGGIYGIFAQVRAEAAGGELAYIDDPLTIDLPSGVTFTSASNNTYEVPLPEPAPWLLLGGGIAALASLRKRALHS